MQDEERFWSKVEQAGGCMVWRGAKDQKTGRGRFWADGKTWDVQRLAWCEENGPMPEGCLAYPVCGETLCVCPHHLALRGYNAAGRAALHKMTQEDIEEACAYIDRGIASGEIPDIGELLAHV